MKRKILISFLGTGTFEKRESRQYRTANYHLGDDDLGNHSFVAAALEKHYGIDSTFLIGTVHSMWEEVYRWHKENDSLPIDEDVYLEIADSCEKANHLSDLSIPHQDAIEEALGNDSKVVLIKYGITEDEVKENINIILGLERFLKNGDELIVDVTHSFRSHPLIMMNLLFYLQNVSKKNICISHIHYGMLEMIKELPHVPILDLKTVMDINNWMIGAYSFSQFGNAYMIASLIKEENKSANNLLNDFSNMMNLNHLFAIRNLAQRLSSIKNAQYNTSLPSMIINPIIDDFIATFKPNEKTKDSESQPNVETKVSVFQLKLARWQLDHRKYAQSFITLCESIVSYVCEINRIDPSAFEDREEAKKALRRYSSSSLRCGRKLKDLYKQIKALRNATAHAIETKVNADSMISTLNKVTNELENIIMKKQNQ